MDTFSLHQFMIRKGKALSDTPEFESYHRTYEPLWDIIAALIKQLESLCSQYAVPLAIVDGKSLADLAQGALEVGREPQMQARAWIIVFSLSYNLIVFATLWHPMCKDCLRPCMSMLIHVFAWNVQLA